jgi:glutamate synthase domain-containing protein 2/glutamate synthase domain-containing protein 1/glutamate synthase domain-containing protein 3
MSTPRSAGLHWPEAERDACGVGFVTSIRGERSHRIVESALSVLANLEHRGAAASDPLTGDGAGILLAIPHELFVATCPAIDLVAPGAYGVGMFFLPPDEGLRAAVVALIDRVVREEGQIVLGWREVPTRPEHAGPAARASMPHVAQLLVGPGTLPADDAALDRKLYVIRKRIEAGARGMTELQDQADGEYPYVASLSTRTIVYKGLLTPEQLPRFYADLSDERTRTPLAIVHQRFSTNTFPSWSRAHPYRRVAHNGEINTLRGNVAWMKAREPVLEAGVFGEDVRKLFPVIDERGSDSAMFDDVLELLVHTGRSLPHAMMMMIPEAWERDNTMDRARRGFYAYHASVMEPWDGPACIAFSDGRYVGAVLDRNGLRPARWATTNDGLVVMASEAGVLELAPETVTAKRRLTPGRMLLIDTREGRIVEDAELKSQIASRRPYGRWASENATALDALAPAPASGAPTGAELRRRERLFGVTEEDVRLVLGPMAERGEEPVGSMGKDSPPAILSDRPQLFFSYFRQLFAQVTNPPIDPIREALVMSLRVALGPEANLFEESPLHAKKLVLDGPILDADAIARVRAANDPARGIVTRVLSTVYPPGGGAPGLEAALVRLGQAAEAAVRDGATIVVLSDRESTRDEAPLPSLLALGAVSQHLVDVGLRHRAGIVVESGEVREVMHVALLLGFGAGAVAPWLADAIVADLAQRGAIAERDPARAVASFHHALEKGVLKVMSKMGISTLSSYRGARIFEALGVSSALLDRWFGGMRSTIEGIGTFELAEDCAARHRAAWRAPALPMAPEDDALDAGGLYRFRRRGERHSWNPGTLALLQHAVRSADREKFRAFQRRVDDETKNAGFLRGLLEIVPAKPIPIDEVEPVATIVKRFKTGAMSFGSISKEAHETLAIAMNRLGGRSNSGEGGEDPDRYVVSQDGTSKRSSIKQVASGRFGVTLEYLNQADEIQIKIAQGAKPGEGGQLPGDKVDEAIAKTRHATPGVQLISPPPHHDIYSIEDLAELIHDLKNANRTAHVSVKLVAESGVGTIAAGVAKAKADVIVVSGDAGGTGAAPLGSVQHAGIPWEIGLAEAQQVLVLNGLRDRVRLETDGQLKTARDVVIATLLGAEEMAFGTAALVASGCVMMRVCHLNSCPVGVATQDPELRARFTGQPEHVIAYFTFLAEEVRAMMAELGFRTMAEMVGRVERLRQRQGITHKRAQTVDLGRLLVAPPPDAARRKLRDQDHELELALDTVLLEEALPAIERREPVELVMPIRNVHRTTGTMLSSEIVRRWGSAGLPDGTVRLRFTGSAGQSLGAFLANGVEIVLEGDANDGVGKGLSGGRIVVFPPAGAGFVPEENVIVGNVALYGATSGEAFFRGIAGERFAVRNSGATAVVEGAGDHACEYMTGGVVVVLGGVGRNFGAGMSGGVAYVLEREGDELKRRVNTSLVDMLPLDETDLGRVRTLVHKHFQRTQSQLAWRILSGWRPWSRRFVKIAPRLPGAEKSGHRARAGGAP